MVLLNAKGATAAASNSPPPRSSPITTTCTGLSKSERPQSRKSQRRFHIAPPLPRTCPVSLQPGRDSPHRPCSEESRQRDRCHRIPCRRRRILKRLAPCSQHAQALALIRRLAIKEPARNRVIKPRDHRIGDGVRKLEVAEISRSLICIEARALCTRSPRASRDLAVLAIRIRIGDHVQQSRVAWLVERALLPASACSGCLSTPLPARGPVSAARIAAPPRDQAPSPASR